MISGHMYLYVLSEDLSRSVLTDNVLPYVSSRPELFSAALRYNPLLLYTYLKKTALDRAEIDITDRGEALSTSYHLRLAHSTGTP